MGRCKGLVVGGMALDWHGRWRSSNLPAGLLLSPNSGTRGTRGGRRAPAPATPPRWSLPPRRPRRRPAAPLSPSRPRSQPSPRPAPLVLSGLEPTATPCTRARSSLSAAFPPMLTSPMGATGRHLAVSPLVHRPPPPSLSSPGFGGAPPRFCTTTSVRGAWFSQRRVIALAGFVVPPLAPPPHRQRRPRRRTTTGPAAERTCNSPGESSAPRLRPLWQCHSPACAALAAAAAAPLGHWGRGGAAGDSRDAAQPWAAVGAVASPTLAGR